MKKIPSVFKRNYEGDRLIYNEVVPGCEWVLEGEGLATRKWDGSSCMIKDGKLYKRYDVKRGRKKPEVGIPCEEKPNENTGHWPWWVPVGDGPADKYHNLAFMVMSPKEDGTYELVGPKINGNRDKFDHHKLIKHGEIVMNVDPIPRTFDSIKDSIKDLDIEGIVFHHPDGRMAKVKKKDYGLKR